MAHFQFLERIQFAARQCRIERTSPLSCGAACITPSGNVTSTHPVSNLRIRRLDAPDLAAPLRPTHPVDDGFGLNKDAGLGHFLAKNVEQILISIFGAEGSIPVNLLLCSHTLDQPMHADSIRVCGIEPADVSQRPLDRLSLLRIAFRIAAAF